MNFEVFVLGTGGMMPLPNRFLTSAMVRREGELFLFDCGEGTQVSLKMLNLRWKHISSIFITHMHADHVTGLPGMLMLSSQVDRTEPLYLYGPRKLKDYVEETRKILDMYINYEIVVVEAKPGVVVETDEYIIEAFQLNHTKPCLGYTMYEKDRPGMFFPEKAKALEIPMGPLWGMLQRGESITVGERCISPDDVMGPKRSGRKFSFVTDTLYLDSIASHVQNSDLLLCEGMFAEEFAESAKEKKHMTAKQAATIAKDAQVKELGLIHYSPRYANSELKLLHKEALEIFPNTIKTKDRMIFDIPLKD